MKKAISVILALLLLSCVCVASFADSTTYSEGKLYYTISDGAVTIVGAFGKDEVITVPSSIAGYPVSTIAAGAFTSRTSLKTLNLPDTVTTVEEGAIPVGVTVVYNSSAAKDGDSGAESGSETESKPGTEPEAEPTEKTAEESADTPTDKKQESSSSGSGPSSKSETAEKSTAETAAADSASPAIDYVISGSSTSSDMPDTVEAEFEETGSLAESAGAGETTVASELAEAPASEAKEQETGGAANEQGTESGNTAQEQPEVGRTSPVPMIIGVVLFAAALAAAVIVLIKKKQ